ncbi:hypothetical protein [Erythrobacter litoralis]|uniref:Uncharacterized protein n=1 Tax=Erythrobacter litoralis (strain HTCC2594) TaxID=314225 RepID=Q2N6C3_ERYLH|nr:hypothetical protein [Erythrobacter litoralis]ABC64768.1 hypothetical protein ELI_13380 [Erythrobacter litoralis HTCC2594]
MTRTKRQSAARFKLPGARRIAIAAALAVAGYFVLADTVANVLIKATPTLASVVAPWNAKVKARALEQEYTLLGSGSNVAVGAAQARLALRGDPTATEALNVLGLQAQLENDIEKTHNIFAYSLRLSRRELPARLWAIEEAVNRGDINAALQNFDTALRTSRTAGDLLFPTLTRALAEPRIRQQVLTLLRRDPIWAPDFIRFASASQLNPTGTLQLIVEGRADDLPVAPEDRRALVDALVFESSFDEAWRYYSSYRNGVRRNASRDQDFSARIANATVFDWILSEFAWSEQEAERSRLAFDIPPTTVELLARQYSVLPAGRYTLRGAGRATATDRLETPYWSLTCRDGRELAQINLPFGTEDPQSFASDLVVPEDCPIQALELHSRAVEDIGGVSGIVEQIAIEPQGGRQ